MSPGVNFTCRIKLNKSKRQADSKTGRRTYRPTEIKTDSIKTESLKWYVCTNNIRYIFSETGRYGPLREPTNQLLDPAEGFSLWRRILGGKKVLFVVLFRPFLCTRVPLITFMSNLQYL